MSAVEEIRKAAQLGRQTEEYLRAQPVDVLRAAAFEYRSEIRLLSAQLCIVDAALAQLREDPA